MSNFIPNLAVGTHRINGILQWQIIKLVLDIIHTIFDFFSKKPFSFSTELALENFIISDYIPKYFKRCMVKMTCADYGFECDFAIEIDSQNSLEQFGIHMAQIHGINYQKESLMTMLASKLNKKS